MTTRTTLILARAFVTLFLLALVVVLFEFYLRMSVAHLVRRQLADSNGVVEASPEGLIDYGDRGRRYIPNAHVTIKNHFLSNRDVQIDINSIGFRDAEIPPDKAPGEFRILVLGDSITAADYVAADETYVSQIQRTLAGGTLASTTMYRVINAGIGNIGTAEELNILVDRGLDTHPDLVILAFYLNDSRRPWGFAGEIGDGGFWRRHSLLVDTIYRHWKMDAFEKEHGSLLLGWLNDLNRLDWQHSPQDFAQLAVSARYDWGAAWQEGSWAEVTPHLDHLAELARRHAFAVAVVMFPVAFQARADFIEDAPQRHLRSLATARGFAVHDLLPLLRQSVADHSDATIFFDQCHLTVEGNRIVGEDIARFLLDRGLLSRKHGDRAP